MFVVFFFTAIVTSALLMLTGFLERQELQAINNRFESRIWLKWSREGLTRLNIEKLLEYKKQHELDKDSWDQTLSWLVEENHPVLCHQYVLFNRLPEDEPPEDAIAANPWMKPLKSYPLSRKTVADMVEFLSKAGAKLIILDNDFPQYSDDDAILAKAIHDAASGIGMSSPVPVLFAHTINRRSTGQFLMESEPTIPRGVIKELEKLEPGVDVFDKYTGITGVKPDDDQVVRRAIIRYTDGNGTVQDSIAHKASAILDGTVNGGPAQPSEIDIDFAAQPNSNLFPVRPLWYLLDPAQRDKLSNAQKDSRDVTIKDRAVIIGDSISDVFSTPLTNLGVDQMSGSEVLVNAIDTLSRRSWPNRLDERLGGIPSFLYSVAVITFGALVWVGWKASMPRLITNFNSEPTGVLTFPRFFRLLTDIVVLAATITGSVLLAQILFAYAGTIVPVVVPAVGLALGAVAAVIWESEKDRQETLVTRIRAAEDELRFAQEKFEADLRRQEAEAKTREVLNDQERRKEFVRRINHDLNAPVSVLNWTLVELQGEELPSEEAQEKLNRLMTNSDRLCELIDQLVQSYDYETEVEDNGDTKIEHCDLASLLKDLTDLQKPLAAMRGSTIDLHNGFDPFEIEGSRQEIMRVIENLVRNALKHNDAGTHVKISASTDNDSCHIKVEDDGKGIAQEHLEHIFESGYRVPNSESDGQGLGLDIVRTLVNQLKGKIEVESIPGTGTTFLVTLRRHHQND